VTVLQRFSARLIAETNINVSVTGVGVVIQGVAVADLDEVVLNGQTVAAENGLYVAHTGSAWTRHTDFDTAAEMLKGTEFYVREGSSDNAGSTWTFDTGGTITVGTTSLKFKRESYGPGAAPTGTGLSRDPLTNQWLLENIFTPTGYFTQVQTDQYGRVLDALESETNTTHIEGLEVTYVSATALDVAPGSAYVPGLNKVVELPLGASLTGLTLTANTFYYLYLFESAGVGQVELVTTTPDDPYLANARTKGGGTPSENHRLIKTLRASATNTLLRWRKEGKRHMHLGDWNTLASSGGLKIHDLARIVATNNTPLDTDLSPLVPPHCRVAEVQGRLAFGTGGTTAWFRHSENTTKTRLIGVSNSNTTAPPFTMLVETDSSRHIEAVQDGGNFVDITLACTGFIEEV
jgi:hypothetical protein